MDINRPIERQNNVWINVANINDHEPVDENIPESTPFLIPSPIVSFLKIIMVREINRSVMKVETII